MNRLLLIFTLTSLILVIGLASALDFSDWEKIDIDDSSINTSSTTQYSVMIPPGITYTGVDSYIGPTTVMTMNDDKNLTYTITIIDNPVDEQLSNETAIEFLDSFMMGANLTPLAGLEPIILSDGIAMYGTQGENAAGVYILSNDEKVTILTGYYQTMDAAVAGIENLAMIAGTIIFKSEE